MARLLLASANKSIDARKCDLFCYFFLKVAPLYCGEIPTKFLEAAKAMKLTAQTELLKIRIIDEIIQEPIGGAHRNKEQVISYY